MRAMAGPLRRPLTLTRSIALGTNCTSNLTRDLRSASLDDEPVRMTRQEASRGAIPRGSLEGHRGRNRQLRPRAGGRHLVSSRRADQPLTAPGSAALDRWQGGRWPATALPVVLRPRRDRDARRRLRDPVSAGARALVPLGLRTLARGRGGASPGDAGGRARRPVDELSLRRPWRLLSPRQRSGSGAMGRRTTRIRSCRT